MLANLSATAPCPTPWSTPPRPPAIFFGLVMDALPPLTGHLPKLDTPFSPQPCFSMYTNPTIPFILDSIGSDWHTFDRGGLMQTRAAYSPEWMLLLGCFGFS